MIISVNWLKKFVSIDRPIGELIELVGERIVEIEDVVDLTDKYRDVIVVRVVECRPVEDSDHLNLTKVDDGGVTEDIERDQNGFVQVVCGANNVRPGMFAAWLPPRSVVPETYHDEVPFVLGARKLRGYISNGMLASARELDLYDDHDGIVDIDKEVTPGTKFADVYELDDMLLDIENKSLTHRPDTFGVVGFAREVAGVLGKPFTTPDKLLILDPPYGDKEGEVTAPRIVIENPALSARYQAVILSGANGKASSPIDIQTYLARSGVRPVNAVVDVTNYLMLLTGQPLHAFDYDKVLAVSGGNAEIHVRGGRVGERLELLDGKIIELSMEDIVIAAGEKAIGLAGAMGGASTAIDENTKNIILESATFNLYNLRTTQMRHGIFSEAMTRFTKGQPSELTAPVLAQAIWLMGLWAGAKRVSDVADAYPQTPDKKPITLTVKQINDMLGVSFDVSEIVQTLKNVEFVVASADQAIEVTAPYWRSDIHITEDIIEEIGRLKGFDAIRPSLPKRDFTAVRPHAFDVLKSDLRKDLVRFGANEVLTYSFIHGNIMRAVGQDTDNAYKIVNSISPDLQYYRQSLLPSLLGLVHPNIKAGYDDVALFELNKKHEKAEGVNEEGVPNERHSLSFVVARRWQPKGAPFYQAKIYLEHLAARLHMTFAYELLGDTSTSPVAAPFEPLHSAIVTDKATGEYIGIVGELKASVKKHFKLPDYTAGFELDTEAILRVANRTSSFYEPISRFPGTNRDMSFRVAPDVTYAEIVSHVSSALEGSGLDSEVVPLDVYRPENTDMKTVTIRIVLTPFDRTLTSEEVASVVDKAAAAVTGSIDAHIV